MSGCLIGFSAIGLTANKVLLLIGFLLCMPTTVRSEVHVFRDTSGQLHWTNLLHFVSGSRGQLAAWSVGSKWVGAPMDSRLVPDTQALSAKSMRDLPVVLAAARKYRLDPAVLLAVIEVESSFNSDAISSTGARGLMQLMPATARHYGLRHTLDLHKPAINVELGARHLSELLATHQGDLPMALASYNAGQPAVKRYGGAIPAYRETMLYVPAVLSRIHAYRSPESAELPYAF